MPCDHPALGRWVKQLPTGRLAIDRARSPRRTPRRQVPPDHVRPDLSAEDVALGYKNLLEAERGFRDMKSTSNGARLPPARTADPCPRPVVLARTAADPRRRTIHRIHLAKDRHRARPDPCRHPHRPGRHRCPHHPTQHHPNQHSAGLQGSPTTNTDHPHPSLTSPNTQTSSPGTGGHTPPIRHARIRPSHTANSGPRLPTNCGTRDSQSHRADTWLYRVFS